MIVLLTFALLAGAGTALSPCVLPVLPALLSAGGVGGRRRPLGVVLGLSITFTVTIVGVANVVDGVGLGSDPLRDLAIAVLLLFGLALLVPAISAAARGAAVATGPLRAALARRRVRLRAAGRRRTRLRLHAVRGPGPGGRHLGQRRLRARGGGRDRLCARARRSCCSRSRSAGGGCSTASAGPGRGAALQRTLGVIMVLTAIAIAVRLDVNFDQFVAEKIPDVNLTAGLECSSSVTGRLHEITGHQPKFVPANGTSSCHGTAATLRAQPAGASQAALLAVAHSLPPLGPAPEFMQTQRWFNTPGGRPQTLRSLRGHVVLIDFWTYTCINCIRTLPYLKAWDATYRRDGLAIVGVETPEFSFERDAGNVANAIDQFGLRYPVVQDNDMGTWNAYGNQYWPADYLIDASGQVRYASFGEGDYDKTETAIRALLAQAGASVGGRSHPHDVLVPSALTTPETYLGTARAEGWLAQPRAGTHDYGPAPTGSLPLNEFAFSGTWNISGQPATAGSGAGIDVEFQAKDVYLVLSSPGGSPLPVQVLLDGRPIAPSAAGADVRDGTVSVRRQRLYSLVSLPRSQRHQLSLRFAPGISGYAFTFG